MLKVRKPSQNAWAVLKRKKELVPHSAVENPQFDKPKLISKKQDPAPTAAGESLNSRPRDYKTEEHEGDKERQPLAQTCALSLAEESHPAPRRLD